MKKVLAAAAALAAAALVLTGCSGSGSDAGSSSSSPSASSTTGAYPVSIPTKFGDVKITKKPTRIVALGWGDAETALELGVQPVGASDWLGFGGNGAGPWDSGKYTTKPTIIGTLQPNYEQIAALHPDLILDVRSSGDAARYQKLSSIAPTVGVPKGGDNYLTTTQQETTMIAEALGEKAQGQALLDKVDAAFTAAAQAHPGWKGKSVTVATRTSDGWGAYTNGDVRVQFLERLGFTLSPTIAKMKPNSSGFSVSISDEQLNLLDANLIVAFPIFIPSSQITGNAQWKAVPAVKAGRDVVVDGTLSNAYSDGTPGAELYALDKLVPMIEQTPLGK
ncbi:iron-siderophore ABC transporter substrate-binding protein [Gryllotalpicola reticulitermitis]|uniref:Iron-siderophore ABC transporter substrate-binding protein n=1 Tax=Gryllotalpicola reticulitermitis TaxID=1184153 RepID=A0ABV8Q6N5_9MICO